MRNLPSPLLRSLGIAVCVAVLAGCASTSEPAGSPTRLAKASCANSTESRIAPPRTECRNVPGRSYSRLAQF
jgi:hypothetical protein